MKKLLLLSLLFVANSIFAQKNAVPKSYEIEEVLWYYQKPEKYIYRTDNFVEAKNRGKKHLKKQGYETSSDEDILFSVTKDKKSDFNFVMANATLSKDQNFDAEVFANQSIKVLKNNYEQMEIPIEIAEKPVQIDGKDFYLITILVLHPEHKHSIFGYFGKIGNSVLTIMALTDNPEDEKLTNQSILNSRFE